MKFIIINVKQKIKNLIKTLIRYFSSKFSSTKLGRYVNEVIIYDTRNYIYDVEHNGVQLIFLVDPINETMC
jgi:hypothetical protein